MPYSSPAGKRKLFEYIYSRVPISSKILDVGAGSGIYHEMLSRNGYDNMDAIEAFPNYILDFYLRDKYNNVYQINALDFDYSKGDYDLVILGDILEHLSEEDARILLDKIFPYAKTIVVSVPYNSIQGTEYGNKLEIHLQPELTKEKFKELCPEFTCIADETIGEYHVGMWIWEKENEVQNANTKT